MAECPICGREVGEGANFCPICGASLHSPAVAAMIQDAHRALAQDPDDANSRYNLAVAYKLAGMDDMAIEELNRVAQLQPDFSDVHYQLGLLHARQGRLEEARMALRRAAELDPEDERAARALKRLKGGG